MADSCARARVSSLSSLPFLLFATLLLLSFTATSTLALSQDPHGSLPNHVKKVVQPREISFWDRPPSPRPTPEPVSGGLERLRAQYKDFNTSSLTESGMTKRAGCVGNGTSIAQFNSFYATRGVNAVIYLCVGSVFEVTETILFAFTGQGLQTEGGSSVPWEQRAKLIITNTLIATAIQSNGCIGCNNLFVDSLVIDGGRLELGALEDGGGLVEMGGTCKNITITNNKISNCRGWSSVHVIEGNCSGATVSDNVIGPSGDSYSTGPIADGISFACKTSLVQNNEIFDASDGAIVVFGAPGTIITNNTITANTVRLFERTRTATRRADLRLAALPPQIVMLGGINMVDYAPYSGSCESLKSPSHFPFWHALTVFFRFDASQTSVLSSTTTPSWPRGRTSRSESLKDLPTGETRSTPETMEVGSTRTRLEVLGCPLPLRSLV
ncbi:hypothetical protein BDY24DRAFT_250365 [Mrakia frigida]|uniref:uncharacterized protein n=1 Tax=Mrakia frigida TaxID=29902 RepID=UPI003FCC08E0